MKNGFQLEEFLPFRLNVLAQEVSERLSEIYSARFELDIPQWRILANLATRGGMTAQEIVGVTLNHKSTISRAVSQLVERRLIERTESTEDKRATVLRITPKGKDLFQKLLPLVLEFERNIVEQLSVREQNGLTAGLAGLERALLPERKQGS